MKKKLRFGKWFRWEHLIIFAGAFALVIAMGPLAAVGIIFLTQSKEIHSFLDRLVGKKPRPAKIRPKLHLRHRWFLAKADNTVLWGTLSQRLSVCWVCGRTKDHVGLPVNQAARDNYRTAPKNVTQPTPPGGMMGETGFTRWTRTTESITAVQPPGAGLGRGSQG